MNILFGITSGILSASLLAGPAPGFIPTTPHRTSTYAAFFASDIGTPQMPIPQEKITCKVYITAYSSTPEETDDTPFITASGLEVQDGILAANFLPFGTRVTIPKLFGDKVFVVQDRMHKRKHNFVDIWMENKQAALRFGIHQTPITILQEQNKLSLIDQTEGALSPLCSKESGII